MLGASQVGGTQVPYSFPSHSLDPGVSGTATTSAHNSHLNVNHPGASSSDNYLFPNMTRTRSKSDSTREPPNWSTGSFVHGQMSGSALDPGVNMGDGLQGSNQQQQVNPASHQQSYNFDQQQAPPSMNHSFSYPSNNGEQHLMPPGADYLSPDMNGLRRSKSDSGAARMGHHRMSRSEDLRPNALLFPPSSHQEFLTEQFLSPQGPMPPIRGHNRRASSGTRSERGAAIGGPMHWSANSSARASPYPSPNVSPRVRYDDLPNVAGVALAGRHVAQDPHEAGNTGVITVSKPNVTTGRTANASHKRRKQEATFVCPVPNCGSTFTRSFNLKGVLHFSKCAWSVY